MYKIAASFPGAARSLICATALSLFLGLVVSSCGQSGPLFLPPTEKVAEGAPGTDKAKEEPTANEAVETAPADRTTEEDEETP